MSKCMHLSQLPQLLTACALLPILPMTFAVAADYPTRPVRVIVPFVADRKSVV